MHQEAILALPPAPQLLILDAGLEAALSRVEHEGRIRSEAGEVLGGSMVTKIVDDRISREPHTWRNASLTEQTEVLWVLAPAP